MKILIYNIKGGQGKTTIAINLALTWGFNLLTNDPLSPVDSILPTDEVLKLDPDEEFPELPDEADVIFDMGGYLDIRIKDALKQADYVIVPVINEYVDVQTTISFLGNLEAYNTNIIIIANKAKKGDCDSITTIMGKFYPQYPIFELKESRSMPNVLREKISVHDMVAQGGLKKYNYQKVADQFSEIMKAIKS